MDERDYRAMNRRLNVTPKLTGIYDIDICLSYNENYIYRMRIWFFYRLPIWSKKYRLTIKHNL